nr:mitochondrial distribution and morphology protein 34 [Quercus suber]
MAFNFNWSPLIADTDRVRDMLTSSLNKSPKPPIIVDDIIVNELNLGTTPPELEILEIGDLAEDRFRGIFKMSYTGDAYLTLKTKVQANPLNTYLSTRPSFASPMPLAASSGLTIPLQITLSDIRLSGFVILVFSKQKGITLVFRNDPLESLKVSSTFDSILFVRDYLQKTIENQLRVLLMEDLPAIIHRLSLRAFSPEYQTPDEQEPRNSNTAMQRAVDPLATPAQQAVDDRGMPIDQESALDTPAETYATFSQKNLLRLATLSESHRTLSLFTPSIPDTVYRAWANAIDRNDTAQGTATPAHRPATLARLQSSLGLHQGGSWSSAASQTSDTASQATRPSLMSNVSTATTYTLGNSRARPHARKRKNRIVNLRKDYSDKDPGHDTVSVSSGYADSASRSESGSAGPSSHARTDPTSMPSKIREGEITTPPRSLKKSVGFTTSASESRLGTENATIRQRPITPRHRPLTYDGSDATPRASTQVSSIPPQPPDQAEKPARQPLPRMRTLPAGTISLDLPRSASELSLRDSLAGGGEGSSGGILEQAWMMKMATEIARKVAEEKEQRVGWRRASADDVVERSDAPPAYVS